MAKSEPKKTSSRPKKLKKMKVGRPSKFKKAFSKEIIEFMSDGSTLTMFAISKGVPRQTLYEWAKKNSDFHDAIKMAQCVAQAVLEERTLRIALGKEDITKQELTALIFSQKARFGISDQAPEDIEIEIADSEDRGQRSVTFKFGTLPDSDFDPEKYMSQTSEE